MGPGRDRTRTPWICSQTSIYCQTRNLLRYAARYLPERAGLSVRHWKENLPWQKYVFLEGIAFQLNNFTMDGFSFQLVLNGKVLPSILMTSFGWKTLPKHPFHRKFGIRSDSRSQG